MLKALKKGLSQALNKAAYYKNGLPEMLYTPIFSYNKGDQNYHLRWGMRYSIGEGVAGYTPVFEVFKEAQDTDTDAPFISKEHHYVFLEDDTAVSTIWALSDCLHELNFKWIDCSDKAIQDIETLHLIGRLPAPDRDVKSYPINPISSFQNYSEYQDDKPTLTLDELIEQAHEMEQKPLPQTKRSLEK